MASAKGQVELVLFDLGGVLVKLGSTDAMQGLASTGSEEEWWDRWLACPWVRSFQRGQCQPEEFAAGVVSDLALAISPAELLQRFRCWPEALFDGAVELVNTVRAEMGGLLEQHQRRPLGPAPRQLGSRPTVRCRLPVPRDGVAEARPGELRARLISRRLPT